MQKTQDHLSISDIQEGIIILKDGGGAMILQTSAVNFGLLSEREQLGIIGAFAQMLNSLSFSIQIVIHSERLNINSYLQLLDKAERAQTNPLLSKMIASYKEFIQTTITENDVLDKKFYVVIPLFSIELGVVATKSSLDQKIKTILIPRRDQIVRQLSRVGLRTTQLTGEKLLELFYDIYNGLPVEIAPPEPVRLNQLPVEKKPQNQPQPTFNNQPSTSAILASQTATVQKVVPPNTVTPTGNNPFVVEELNDVIV